MKIKINRREKKMQGKQEKQKYKESIELRRTNSKRISFAVDGAQ